MRPCLTALALLLASIGGAAAQPVPSPEALNWMRLQVGRNIQRDPYLWSVGQVEAFVRPAFLAVSRDGKRITPADRETAAKTALAQARMALMQQFLAADRDGTGRIDRAMLREALTRAAGVPRGSAGLDPDVAVEAYFRDADQDRDGFVTYQEAAAAADRQLAGQLGSRQRELLVPGELDLDGDGDVTIEEYLAALRIVFEEADTDRDGRISQSEAQRFQADAIRRAERETREAEARRRTLADARAKAAGCGIPDWDGGAILAAVVARPLVVPIDISIGPDGEIPAPVNVHIEPGDRPLSVVLDATWPALWQFTGEVARVRSVYVAQQGDGDPRRAGRKPASGVSGVRPESVKFAPRVGCLPEPRGIKDPNLTDALGSALGRQPDVVASSQPMSTARLPSGAVLADGAYPNLVAAPKDGPGAPLWAMAAESGGAVVHVDPSAVTAAGRVERIPLPGLAGLAVMVDEGRARISAWQNVTRFFGPNGERGSTIIGNATIVAPDGQTSVTTRIPSEMLLLAQVAVPTGLKHSELRRLVVARGVPAPTGDLGGICVVREEDAQPVPGSRCD